MSNTPTFGDRAAAVCQSIRRGHDPGRCLVCAAVAQALAEAVAAERRRCLALARRVQTHDQRAVSWHEVTDVIEAIHRGDQP